MTMRRFAPTIRRVARKRKSSWAFQSLTATAAADIEVDLLANWRTEMGITANLPGMTAGPIFGAIYIAPPAALTVQNARASFGIRRYDRSVLPGGTASGVTDEPISDWMWMQVGSAIDLTNFWFVDPQTGTGAPGAINIAVRSKRKLDEPNQSILLLGDLQIDDLDTLATITMWTRTLLTLP